MVAHQEEVLGAEDRLGESQHRQQLRAPPCHHLLGEGAGAGAGIGAGAGAGIGAGAGASAGGRCIICRLEITCSTWEE